VNCITDDLVTCHADLSLPHRVEGQGHRLKFAVTR